MNLMFLDECYCWKVRSDSTFISSMTAVIVPANKYNLVRTAFYDILKPFINPETHTVNLVPPELHGSTLLKDEPDADDQVRFTVFHQIVDLIVQNKLDIYRVGYYITPEYQVTFKGDEQGTSICWLGILEVTQPLYQDEQLIPIMDGFNDDTVRKMSLMVRECDIMRSAGLGDSVSLMNTSNIIGEVFYADSRYSALIQVVDVISYLRHVNDLSQEGKSFSSFKNGVLVEAKRLDSMMKHDTAIEMNRICVNRLTGETIPL
jgi:hypothetical protein